MTLTLTSPAAQNHVLLTGHHDGKRERGGADIYMERGTAAWDDDGEPKGVVTHE